MEDEAFAGDEGKEEVPGGLEHASCRNPRSQRLVRAGEQWRRVRRAPGRAVVGMSLLHAPSRRRGKNGVLETK